MRCPNCANDDTRVVDSRLADGGATVRRRRECAGCQQRFTTFETVDIRLPRVIKSDGRREAFAEQKLRAGVTRSLEKRPVDTDDVEAMISRLLRDFMSSGEREISSRRIGERVMAELAKLDQVAYVRFASVYRNFQDLDEFNEEVKRLKDQPGLAAGDDQLSLLERRRART